MSTKDQLIIEGCIMGAMAIVIALYSSGIDRRTLADSSNSLGHLNLISTLEEDFGLRFTTDEIVELKDFTEICAVVSEKLPATGI